MKLKFCICIKIIDQKESSNIIKTLKLGHLSQYKDKQGNLFIYKRIWADEINKYKIKGVKIS